MQGLLMLKRIYIKKKSKEIFVRENLKKSIIIKNVIWSEDTVNSRYLEVEETF